ncbi:hypothetical protein MBANPS3_001823 [Mucor bainieri]
MSIFQPKPSIQLSTEQEQGNGASQRPPTFSRKSSSSWSIPCCSHISLGKSGGRIQLPDDSDNDSIDEEYNQPSPTPFSTAFSEDTQSQNLPNVFSQAQARSQTALSRNPFARVDEERQSKPTDRQITPQTEHQIDSFIPEIQASGEEELATVTRSRFARYDNEPDWTEAYKDDGDDDDDEPIRPAVKGFQIQNEDAESEDGAKSDTTKNAFDTQTTHTIETSAIPTDQTSDTNCATRSTIEAEEAQTEEADKVPQIEEEVLHLLPLPELSNEIPPAMIHKKASFEKSMYGEQPLMSVGRHQNSRISRFSMTEEDYLALKKAEEQDKRAAPLNTQSITSPTMSTRNQNNNAEQEAHPPAVADIKPQEEAIKDDRRASIAQSILGDKLDDFTEKLAFIKKNIIMSIDSDEEDDEEISAEKILKKMEQAKSTSASNANTSTSDQKPTPTLHRRASSLMDAVPTIARFMNQIGGGNPTTPEPSTSTNVPLSSSQTSASSFSPSSLFSALAGPMPEPSSTLANNKKTIEKRAIQEEGSGDENDEEELFDFNKVLEIGKNVKTFGEGFVGNGIRMFNDVATRMKTTVEEEQKRAAQISAQKNESTSTASSSSNNENEWMHNYL